MKNNKKYVYVITKTFFHNIEGTITLIIGVYENIGNAKRQYLKEIEESKEDNYIIDEKCDKQTINYITNSTRLFSEYQENWDNYIELVIQKEDLK